MPPGGDTGDIGTAVKQLESWAEQPPQPAFTQKMPDESGGLAVSNIYGVGGLFGVGGLPVSYIYGVRGLAVRNIY